MKRDSAPQLQKPHVVGAKSRIEAGVGGMVTSIYNSDVGIKFIFAIELRRFLSQGKERRSFWVRSSTYGPGNLI